MLKRAWFPICLAGLLSAGCATHTGTGALAGGALGAGTGAIIGSATGNAGVGSLIGGGLGTVAGSLVGAGFDHQERKTAQQIAQATAPAANIVSVDDVIRLTQSGVGEEVIISSIHSSGTTFHLAATDIIALHQQGVNDRVIQAMIDSGRRVAARSRVVVEPEPIYVVEPPPPRVAIGFGYGRCYPRYCW